MPCIAAIVSRVCIQCVPIGRLICSRSVHTPHVRTLLGLAADMRYYGITVAGGHMTHSCCYYYVKLVLCCFMCQGVRPFNWQMCKYLVRMQAVLT